MLCHGHEHFSKMTLSHLTTIIQIFRFDRDLRLLDFEDEHNARDGEHEEDDDDSNQDREDHAENLVNEWEQHFLYKLQKYGSR